MLVEVNLPELVKTMTEILRKATSQRSDYNESQQVSGLSTEEYKRIL
jgi:hypothetical protein